MIGEFDPQRLEQVVDREFDLFGVDDSSLKLIDLEKSVQHAQHDIRRLVELRDQFQAFLVLDLLGQNRRIKLRVCSGCRRSWLAAERMRDFPRLARSECHLAAINAISACLRSVTSSIATSVSPRRRRFVIDLLPAQQQHSTAQSRNLDFDFIVFDSRRWLGSDQESREIRQLEPTITDRRQGPADDFIP